MAKYLENEMLVKSSCDITGIKNIKWKHYFFYHKKNFRVQYLSKKLNIYATFVEQLSEQNIVQCTERNFFEILLNQIVFPICRLIWNQTDVLLDNIQLIKLIYITYVCVFYVHVNKINFFFI